LVHSGNNEGIRSSRLTVSGLTAKLKDLLETEFGDVEVEGEISNFTAHRSGHWYFTLKDKGAELQAVMFKYSNKRAVMPSEGDRVVVFGRLVIYAPRGRYQIVCDKIEQAGAGDLWKKYQELKKKLEEEGLFEQDRKRPLPRIPETIALVTSKDAAALQDMLRVLHEKKPSVRIILRPAAVQGLGAGSDIAQGIVELNAVEGVEVIVVGRGGGSIEDLWAFNEEVVARAIAASRVPVVSAVGHESDVMISDLVADLRAPTPTAAMEWILPDKEDISDQMEESAVRMKTVLEERISSLRKDLSMAGYRLKDPKTRLAENRLILDGLFRRLEKGCAADIRTGSQTFIALKDRLLAVSPANELSIARGKLETKRQILMSLGPGLVEKARQKYMALNGRLAVLSPISVLERGYAIVFDKAGKIVKEASELEPDQPIHIMVHRGALRARVESVEAEGS